MESQTFQVHGQIFSPKATLKNDAPIKLEQREIKKLAMNSQPPTEPRVLRSMAIDAQLAAYPYHRSLEKISEAGDIHKPEKRILPLNGNLLRISQN